MIHEGNKIINHARSEESIQLIFTHLMQLEIDSEETSPNSLYSRFFELVSRAKDQQTSHEATWNHLLKVLVENVALKS